MDKTKILEALNKFARQRPGLEFDNYGDIASYRAESRQITRDLHEFNALFTLVESRTSITADDILKSAKNAYSGRLTITPDCKIKYCVGQYWPTEYRRAACAALSSALWADQCDNRMPEPDSIAGMPLLLGAP